MSPFLGILAQPDEQQATQAKFLKSQVDFREKGLALYVCGQCRHFLRDGKACQIVDEAGEPSPGEINADDLCDLWNAGLLRQRIRERRFGRGPPS